MEREKTRPAWPVGCLCATKLAQQAQNRRKTPFLGVLGELIRGRDVGRCVLGEFCTGWADGSAERGEFCTGWAAGAVQSSPCWGRGGGCGTKFSLLVQNWLKWAFLGVLGDFCTGDAAEATRDECLSVRSLSLWSPRIRRGEISHAIPLNVFQNLNSDR